MFEAWYSHSLEETQILFFIKLKAWATKVELVSSNTATNWTNILGTLSKVDSSSNENVKKLGPWITFVKISRSGRVIARPGSSPNYCASFEKTQKILTGYGISLLPGDRDLPTGRDVRYFCLSGENSWNRQDSTFKRQMLINQINKTSVKKVRAHNNPSRPW